MFCLLCQSIIVGFNQQKYTEYYNSLPKAADDDYEFNDTYDQATPLQNISLYQSFILQDIDWFVLSLNASDNITIMIQTDSDLADMEINFYESDGVTPVAGSIIGGDGIMWIIAVPNLPETGNYYFSLLPLSDAFAYSIWVMTDEFDDAREENDVIEDACDITEGFGYDLLYSLDDDWYKIYLEAGETLELYYACFKTDSFELNFIGTDGTTILEPSTEESEEEMGIINEILFFNESVIDTTGYYYIQVTSDTPTIYIFECHTSSMSSFEKLPMFLNLYQHGEYYFDLYWNYLEDAEFYYIFRENSEITTVDGLTPFTTTEDTYFEQYIEESGDYYYVVMGNNGTHNSSISNCVNVTIKPFEEISITLSLYLYDQYARLYWGMIDTAEYYYIFRETSEITSVDGLTPIATLVGWENNNYEDLIIDYGEFYYVVIANNGTHNTSISNCVSYEIFPFNEIIPELDPIIPNIDEDGNIRLKWDYIYNASVYYIFRETSPITTIDGLNPIANRTYSNYYYDQINENGTYYYVVIANNGTVNSSISNCENVTCLITPFYEQAPYIQYIGTDWEQSGTIWVQWTELNNALEYYVYRDIIPITDIGILDPFVTVTGNMLDDQVYENGTYYYVVVANNGTTNSTPSSCKNIEVLIKPFYERVPYFWISPYFSTSGDFTLEWEGVSFAVEYSIFRETTFITDIDGLTPIVTILDDDNYWFEYYDTVSESGTYYYVIVANNGTVNSQISECRSVDALIINFEELAPFLYEIDPNPSITGNITIEWEIIEGSENYYIYRETSIITTIDGLTPIGSTFDAYHQGWFDTFTYVDNINKSETYYYVIVAYNGEIYSSISNCESVAVEMHIVISGFNILTFGLVISCTASVIIVSIRKRRNSLNTST